jgi:cytoskeletal protein CcmA (bactofilin family)
MTDISNELLEEEDFDTILSKDIEFSGTINFDKPFLIRGKVSGTIDATGILIIDEDAEIEADIRAAQVIIRGSVTGDVTATEKVEISAAGKLVGDVTAPDGGFFMETGCTFHGRCVMLGAGGGKS